MQTWGVTPLKVGGDGGAGFHLPRKNEEILRAEPVRRHADPRAAFQPGLKYAAAVEDGLSSFFAGGVSWVKIAECCGR